MTKTDESASVVHSSEGLVATVWGGFKGIPNADLIAAAPDLLAACRKFVNLPGDYNMLSDAEHVFDDARAAIAKAAGKQ